MAPSPLLVLMDSLSEGLAPYALPCLAAEAMEELNRAYSMDTVEQFSKLRLSRASRCFYPFEVRTQEDTGSTRWRNMLGVAQPAALQISVSEAPRACTQEDVILLVE